MRAIVISKPEGPASILKDDEWNVEVGMGMVTMISVLDERDVLILSAGAGFTQIGFQEIPDDAYKRLTLVRDES